MIRSTLLIALVTGVVWPELTAAQEEVPTPEPTPWYENNDQVPYPDNTGALGITKTDNTADIVNENEEIAAGALEGEITIWKREDKFVVYSNGNRIEDLIKGIGAIGSISEVSSSSIDFEPTGKQSLVCPAQDIPDWFGPCKLEGGTD